MTLPIGLQRLLITKERVLFFYPKLSVNSTSFREYIRQLLVCYPSDSVPIPSVVLPTAKWVAPEWVRFHVVGLVEPESGNEQFLVLLLGSNT